MHKEGLGLPANGLLLLDVVVVDDAADGYSKSQHVEGG